MNFIKEVCESKDFCNIAMTSKDTRLLEFNWYCKSDKAPFIIYPDLESLIVKILMNVKIIWQNHLQK